MNIRTVLLCMVMLPLVACAREADSPQPAATATASAAAPAEVIAPGDPRITLAAKIPGAKPEDLRATPVPGIFEVSHGTDISYITADGAYVFSGDLYRISTTGDFPNLTDARRRELRQSLIAAVPESRMLVFGPADAPHTITVFTDIDCPWCQRMHAQVNEYNKLGIRVRYLFYPRSGPGTESWFKADTVWCSADRNDAFTRAKREEPLEIRECPDSPVAADYQLGRDMGVTGTPGVLLASGELIPGYLTPPQMLAHINEEAAAATAAAP